VFGAGEPSREDRAQDGCLMPLHGVGMIWGSAFGNRHSGSTLGTWARLPITERGFRTPVRSGFIRTPSAERRVPVPFSTVRRYEHT
jgi:hypothetical protein